jgi:hypothetical protein
MSSIRTLLGLSIEAGVFDGSPGCHKVALSGGARAVKEGRYVELDGTGAMTIARSKALDELQGFTLEASITLSRLGGRQNIAEGQTPPIALFVEPDGTLVGSVNTARGWQSLRTNQRLAVGKPARVRFLRNTQGVTMVEIDDRPAAEGRIEGALVPVGTGGLVIGAGADARAYAFHGRIADVRVRGDALPSSVWKKKVERMDALAVELGRKFGKKVRVVPDPDAVDHRFDHVKSIMAAAGVRDLSKLSTLRIDRRVVLSPGTVMVAPQKATAVATVLTWAELAKKVDKASPAEAVNLLAGHLANRNSEKALKRAAPTGPGPTRPIPGQPRRPVPERPTRPGRGPVRVRRASPLTLMTNAVRFENGALRVLDPSLVGLLGEAKPADWPALEAPTMEVMALETIPVNSSVIIAGVLDLTNQQLVIEPTVATLCIIAEEVVCGSGATITWRRPGGSTPARQPAASKNGQSWSGVHTDGSSKRGLDGGDGLDGDAGAAAANGAEAPNLELWVKRLSAMPNIDLNGEDGIRGGRGQPGGRGGNGADGQGGEWWWFFGARCWSRPGNGGDGGDGGDGGPGGPGGSGGRGGELTVAVLEGTLATTLREHSFRMKNQGGQPGRGGDGGPGGEGGRAGSGGANYVDGEAVCSDVYDGHAGERGQPGREGNAGHMGTDGLDTFMEFTEESWNEMLTRPWLYELMPTTTVPGMPLTIKGTRFADTDRVVIAGTTLTPVINADETLTVTLPSNLSGGTTEVHLRRFDGTESNRLRLKIKPQLLDSPAELVPGASTTLTGRAFLAGASVLFDGDPLPATVSSATELSFEVPQAATGISAQTEHRLSVRNPDALVSNERTAVTPGIIDIGFKIGVHDFSFDNFARGLPSWGTYTDTFGALEVYHEVVDPVFGHPILTLAFYAFYHYFLEGTENGGLATGYCTSLSATALDEFWRGSNDTHARYRLDDATLTRFTAIHGRLLSRETLLELHDQGREGNARVATTFREIESRFQAGCDRESAPMLFFIPSGDIWDSGYFDKLSSSHCIVPIRIVYPVGYDGTSLNGVKVYCWDCNHPPEESATVARDCRFELRQTGSEVRFDYYAGGTSRVFRSEDGITLGMMTVGDYLLADHDLPFSGPLGLTTFIVDFLLSPAELQVTDAEGRRAGRFGAQILAEIPDSHPCYLAKGAYLLPTETALSRKIVGTGTGAYTYHSVSPGGLSVTLEGVSTHVGEEDLLDVSADGCTLRFTPGVNKAFRLTLGRELEGAVRGVSVDGVGGASAAAVDVSLSPDLSVVRVGNRGVPRTVGVRVFGVNTTSGVNARQDRGGVALPTDNDLVVTVTNWDDLSVSVRALPF